MNDSNRFHDNGDPSFPLPNGDNTNLHNHDDQEIWLSPSGDHVHLAKTSTKGSNTGNNNVLTGTEKLVIQRRYQCIDLDEEASLKLGEYDDDDSMVAPSDPDHSIDQSRKQPSHSKETSSTNSSKQSTFLENKNDPYSDNIRKNINCPTMWTRWILQIQKPIRFVLVETSVFAAQHPVSIVFGIAILATVLVITGFLTNFHIENREDQLWTPQGSLPDQHSRWIKSVFPLGSDPRQYYLMMLLHAQGNNVVSYEGMQLQFNILERIRSVPDYAEFCLKYGTPVCGEEEEPSLNLACQWYGIPTEDSNRDCDIIGVTRFWFSNYTVFKNMVNSDADIQKTLSINVFPGKLANFDISNIVGYPEFDSNETMTFGKSFLTYIEFNRTDFDRSEALERSVTDELRKLQTEIHANSSNSFRLEIMATRSFEDEFVRGVYKDFVLLPVVGFFMTAFTCLVFYKHGDPLNSRVLLGMGATITVLVSIMTGYGLLFIIGVPFTSLSQVSSIACPKIMHCICIVSPTWL
jgi:Niemann-Pick C1 protein